MAIGQRIKRRRLDLKLKQHELAAAVGVKQATVSDWEAEKFSPSRDIIKSIADFLQTTPGQLEYGIEDYLPPDPPSSLPPGESITGSTKQCAYNCAGSPAVQTVASYELCPISITR